MRPLHRSSLDVLERSECLDVMSSSPYSLPKFNRKILPQNFLEMLYFFYSVDARLDFVGFEIFAESGSICVFQTLF